MIPLEDPDHLAHQRSQMRHRGGQVGNQATPEGLIILLQTLDQPQERAVTRM